jgi:hypothetical protein
MGRISTMFNNFFTSLFRYRQKDSIDNDEINRQEMNAALHEIYFFT